MVHMIGMHQVNLRSVDLNLLTILEVLFEERSVTRTGTRLGMSQPAVSRALARLRILFGDPLLVESSGGYVLSERALEIGPALRRSLAEIGDMLEAKDFVAGQATGRVRLATPDLYAAVIMPPLMTRIEREAPQLDLDIVAPGGTFFDRLENGEIDAVLGVIDEAPASFRRRKLFEDAYVMLLRADHPASNGHVTLDQFLTLQHIAISITGSGPSPIDRMLAASGRERRVKVRVPSFLAAVQIAARSDLVVTLPKSLARNAPDMKRFVMKKPPADPGGFTLSMVWHVRNQSSRRHVWLRNAIIDAVAQVDAEI